MSASSRLHSRSSSPLSFPSPTPSIPATPGKNWSPRPGMSDDFAEGFACGLPEGSLPGSTAVSPSWSPAALAGSLILGEPSPPSSPSADLLEEDLPRMEATQKKIAAGSGGVNTRYCFDDGLSYFLVENQIFRVHRHFLVRDSIYFQEIFAGPLGALGEHEREAIPLDGVGSSEFECLLDFFYTGMYTQSAFALSQWLTLLSISTRLRFDRLRTHAIEAIERDPTPIEPVDKIVLATKYRIPSWLPSAYAALCRRPSALEEWEAEKIGLRSVVLIAKAREVYRERAAASQFGGLGQGPTTPSSPVFSWKFGHAQSLLSPMGTSMAIVTDLEQLRAERVVSEVFFGVQ
ncbi:BTB domain-containing protein [Mycena chlorophos]|uniref:BTB domain-containing protein n=1 Tax=Mycena chlorophos TaxID=658473 RepID=A0A8H6TN09_MYCCL|nr:BTB domain-containing protein [Mycena chlorophos]